MSDEYIVWGPGELPEQFRDMEKIVPELDWHNGNTWGNIASGVSWRDSTYRMRKVDYERIREKVRPDGETCDEECWISWKGGECPVSSYLEVEVKFRDGNTSSDLQAGMWSWTHNSRDNDIVAYRVIGEHPKQSKRPQPRVIFSLVQKADGSAALVFNDEQLAHQAIHKLFLFAINFSDQFETLMANCFRE